jgi:hypothetical protein
VLIRLLLCKNGGPSHLNVPFSMLLKGYELENPAPNVSQ